MKEKVGCQKINKFYRSCIMQQIYQWPWFNSQSILVMY